MTSVRQNGKLKRNKSMEREAENMFILSKRMRVLSPKGSPPYKGQSVLQNLTEVKDYCLKVPSVMATVMGGNEHLQQFQNNTNRIKNFNFAMN